ncbi:SICAvar, type I (fragment), partial [Plasmodium knowlesi strain H]
MVSGSGNGGGAGGGGSGTGGAGAAGGTTPMFQEWLEKLSTDGALTSSSSGQNIAEKVRTDLEKTWKKLEGSLVPQESAEIHKFCGKGSITWPAGSGAQPQYMEILCQALLEIKYFVSGVSRRRKLQDGKPTGYDEAPVIADFTEDKGEAFNRCIVGTVALSTIYGDHCKLMEVIEKVETNIGDKVDAQLIEHLKQGGKSGKPDLSKQLNKCSALTYNDLIVGKSVLGDTIKLWTKQKRDEGNSGPWRIKIPWSHWPSICNSGKQPAGDSTKQKEYLKDNASSMTDFMKLSSSTTQSSSAGTPSISDVLVNEDYTIPKDKLLTAFESVVQSASTVSSPNSLDVKTLMDSLTKLSQDQS